MLGFATIAISLALVSYTIAVWWERASKMLKGRHLLLFWIGLVFDTTGTTLMGKLAGSIFQLNFHGITGMLAILLMLFHAVWATAVHASRREEPKRSFHKLSVFVWAVWLIPYLSGMVYGMGLIR
jgi:TIGR03987 family protein